MQGLCYKDSESREKTGTCSLFSEAHPIFCKDMQFGHTAESPYIGISITAAPIYYKYDIGIGASAIFNLLCSNHFIKSLNFCRLSLTHKPNAVLFPSRSTQ